MMSPSIMSVGMPGSSLYTTSSEGSPMSNYEDSLAASSSSILQDDDDDDDDDEAGVVTASALKLLRASCATDKAERESASFTPRRTSAYAQRVAATRRTARRPRYESADPSEAQGALRAFVGRSQSVAEKQTANHIPTLTVDVDTNGQHRGTKAQPLYSKLLRDLPSATTDSSSRPTTGMSDEDLEFEELGRRIDWLEVAEEERKAKSPNDDERSRTSPLMTKGSPAWREEPTTRGSSSSSSTRGSESTWAGKGLRESLGGRDSFESTKGRVKDARSTLKDAMDRGDAEYAREDSALRPLAQTVEAAVNPFRRSRELLRSPDKNQAASESFDERPSTARGGHEASSFDERPSTARGRHEESYEDERPSTARMRHEARQTELMRLQQALENTMVDETELRAVLAEKHEEEEQEEEVHASLKKSFSCQADGRDANVGRVLEPRQTKAARAGELLARHERAAAALRALAALEASAEDEPRGAMLQFDLDSATQAAACRYLHVSDIVSEQKEKPVVDAPLSAPLSDVPTPKFRVHGDLRSRFDDIDELAANLELELEEGRLAMVDFEERASEGLAKQAAERYATMIDANRMLTRAHGEDEEDFHSPTRHHHSQNSTRPITPMTASAELRAAGHIASANDAFLELQAALRKPSFANKRGAATIRKKKQQQKPRADWRDPKGTALW